jgi:hydroxymethylpyrimidine pyrophosphatase-like HAD family hydrolase
VTVLVATDLDRTLIYSHAAMGDGPPAVLPVERHDGAEASFMTVRAARSYVALHDQAVVVPVTTRVPAQWQRVRLPGPASRYAVTANGAILLVAGEVDHDWSEHVAVQLAGVAPLAEIWEHVAAVCRPEWTVKVRNARGLFCYAVLHRKRVPVGFFAECAAWAAERGWRTSVQGRKHYWVPRPLTKTAAVAEVATRVGASTVLAAGDSLLDLDLVRDADRAIVPAHGELATSGWAAPHVEVTTRQGVLAGEEIVDWFSSCAGALRAQ